MARRPVDDIARELCVGSVHGERGAIECRCEEIAAALLRERDPRAYALTLDFSEKEAD